MARMSRRTGWIVGCLTAVLLGTVVLAASAVRGRSGPAALVEALASRDSGTDVFLKLEGSTDPEIHQAVVAGLSHPSHRVRQMCLRLLARSESPDVVAPVRACLDDPDRFVRVQAARTLVQISDSAEVLAEVRRTDCPFARREVLAKALAAEQVEGVNELLLEWIADRRLDVRTREWATTLLGSECCLSDALRRKACTGLSAIVADSQEPVNVRGACALALGRVGHQEAFPALLALYSDASQPARLREGAIAGLGRTTDPRARAVLQELLDDPSQASSFRTRALDALVCLLGAPQKCGEKPQDGPLRELLHRTLTDENREVRLKTVFHLKCRVGPDSLPFIRQAQMTETDDCAQRDLVEMALALERKMASP